MDLVHCAHAQHKAPPGLAMHSPSFAACLHLSPGQWSLHVGPAGWVLLLPGGMYALRYQPVQHRFKCCRISK
jgi:hypothetical protein